MVGRTSRMPARQREHHPDLDEGREVVAGGEQQPHRQRGGREAVDDHGDGQRGAGEGEDGRPLGRLRDPLAGHDREQDEDEADGRGLHDPARAPEAHVEAHEHRDRDGHGDGEGAPRRVLERVDDDEGDHREQDDHDREDGDHGEEAGPAAHLVAGHLPERAAVAAQREEEDHEVLHAAAEDRPRDEPERPRQVAELRGQGRADERPRPRDRREVVAEHHPAVRGHEVAPVVEPLRRRRAGGVEGQDPRREEGGVEAVGDEVRAARRRPRRRGRSPARRARGRWRRGRPRRDRRRPARRATRRNGSSGPGPPAGVRVSITARTRARWRSGPGI